MPLPVVTGLGAERRVRLPPGGMPTGAWADRSLPTHRGQLVASDVSSTTNDVCSEESSFMRNFTVTVLPL